MEDSTSSKSDGDGSDQEDGIGGMGMAEREREPKLRQVEDDELGDGLKVTLSSDGSLDTNDSFNSHRHHPLNHQDAIGGIMGMAPNALSSAPVTIGASTDLLTPNAAATRRRRKLPEIPKNQKCK
ncbi:GL15409 [Drosophila persimilis]|uniref:GL15409 n=1 Tax=Drosophila persimilis TaxID=7234 RepID=B4IQW8_DROPE|nr:GL15409 [Drosophila persimilis]